MSIEQQAESAAREFMRQKGYPDLAPDEVEKVEDMHVWYFYFSLPQGELELEVEWDGAEWSWGVMNFIHFDDEPEETASPMGR